MVEYGRVWWSMVEYGGVYSRVGQSVAKPDCMAECGRYMDARNMLSSCLQLSR